MLQSRYYLLCLFILSFFATSCVKNPVTGKRQVMFMSKKKEKALGLQSDPGIIASYGLYDDAKIQDFIVRKGNQMVKTSHMPNEKFSFRILDSPVVNAFAVPGGYVYFTRGIMAHFNNEAQFAGVLGHEIGHVTARHSAEQYTKQILAQVGMVAGMVVSEDFRNMAGDINQGVGLLFLKFSRDNESQSDILGVQYSSNVGYDAHEMAGFFKTLKRLQEEAGAAIPGFLSTHPDPGDRFNNVLRLAKERQATENRNWQVRKAEYFNLIDGIVYGEDPLQGYTDENVFYHPSLKFKFPYPQDWQLQNTPSAVAMAPKDGKAYVQFSIVQAGSLQEASNAFLQEAQATAVSQNNVKVNGLNAIKLISQQSSQLPDGNTQVIQILSYFIKHGEFIYNFNGMSLKADYNRYKVLMEKPMLGFANLTDKSKIDVKPERINIVKAKSHTTLQKLLAQEKIPASRLEEFAILNGMELSDPLKVGDMIKVLEKNTINPRLSKK